MSTYEKMVPDEDTAYDEVIEDLQSLADKHIKNPTAKILFVMKIRQLLRLLGDSEEEEE